MTDLDLRRRRLLFRASHRGTRENDLMIGSFVAARLAALTEPEIAVLERLMEVPDSELAGWLWGRVPVPSEMDGAMLTALRAHVAAGGAVVRP